MSRIHVQTDRMTKEIPMRKKQSFSCMWSVHSGCFSTCCSETDGEKMVLCADAESTPCMKPWRNRPHASMLARVTAKCSHPLRGSFDTCGVPSLSPFLSTSSFWLSSLTSSFCSFQVSIVETSVPANFF